MYKLYVERVNMSAYVAWQRIDRSIKNQYFFKILFETSDENWHVDLILSISFHYLLTCPPPQRHVFFSSDHIVSLAHAMATANWKHEHCKSDLVFCVGDATDGRSCVCDFSYWWQKTFLIFRHSEIVTYKIKCVRDDCFVGRVSKNKKLSTKMRN